MNICVDALASAAARVELARQPETINHFRVHQPWGWTRALSRFDLLNLLGGLRQHQQAAIEQGEGCDMVFNHRDGVLAISGTRPMLVSLHALVDAFKNNGAEASQVGGLLEGLCHEGRMAMNTVAMQRFASAQAQMQVCDFYVELTQHLQVALAPFDVRVHGECDLHEGQMWLSFAAASADTLTLSQDTCAILVNLQAVYQRGLGLYASSNGIDFCTALSRALVQLLQRGDGGVLWSRIAPLTLHRRVQSALERHRPHVVSQGDGHHSMALAS